MTNKKLQIRNSTAEFLIFTSQAGENGIEVCPMIWGDIRDYDDIKILILYKAQK